MLPVFVAFVASIYAATVSYVMLALLKLYIVARPLRVRETIRLGRIVGALGVT